jgi:hypothetical protein
MRCFDAKHGGLQCIHSEVPANELVVVLGFHSVCPQHTCSLGQCGIIGCQESSVAKRSEVLARIEGEAADGTNSAHRSRLVRRADRLGSVFHNGDPCFSGRREDWVQIGAQPEEMDWKDRSRSRRDSRSRGGHVQVERRGIDVDEHRTCPEAHDAAGRRKKRVR